MEKEVTELLCGDGLHNVQPPEGWVDPVEQATVESGKVNAVTYSNSLTEPPYKSDIIQVPFTPEQLHLLNEVLKRTCLDNPLIEYVDDEMKLDRYEQQTYIRNQLIGKIDVYLDEYIIHRPYTPLLTGWVRRIGREDVRKLQT